MNSPEIMEPSACTWCGIARRGHGRQYADAAGWHGWEQPSQEQILARMKARRLQLAVARAGALPVPAGGERTLDVVEEELTGVNLALWEEIEAYARLRVALASAQRSRRELRARVAELEAERHSTNEALDDAVQALRVNRASEPTSGGYPPALPWAALMDDEDLQEFLGDLLDSLNSNPPSTRAVLAEVEKTCGQWRLIAEAQHGHNTAPGPDAVTAVFVPVASLREVPDGEHAAWVRHSYRTPHDLDLPETQKPRDPQACQSCGSLPESWCPDCAACQKGCFGGFDGNSCVHSNASWGGRDLPGLGGEPSC